jgi:beta-lactam-binding protein with PASTA domain
MFRDSVSTRPTREHTRTMAFRRRPPRRRPPPYPGPPPDEQVTLVQGAPPPPPPGEPPLAPPPEPPLEPDRELWPWLVVLLVLVMVGAGLAAYFATRGPSHHKKVVAVVTVPAVIGFKEGAAVARVQQADLSSTVDRVFSKKGSGFVISQRPLGGATLRKGGVVALTVSRGPSSVAVPNLISLSEADAVAQLTKLGLRADVVQVPSSQAAGTVIAQNPKSGVSASPGSSVRLNVSKGPTHTTTVVTTAPTTTTTATTATTTGTTTTTPTTTSAAPANVPDVVGQVLPDAAVTMKASHLLPDSYPVNSSEAGGTVVAENPAAGETAPARSIVRLNVSVGTSRPLLGVPDVTAHPNDEISARQLLSKKFTVRAVPRSAATAAQRGLVLAQLPHAGVKVKRWAQIIIYVGR